ncbi:MAG: stage II sporulation protein M [Candidatus Eisenbacteria bacterium]
MIPSRPFMLKSLEFRKERESSWLELEELLARTDRSGLRNLRAEEIVRLVELYRATTSALSVARSISLDKNLLAYLEALSQRAYLTVYAPRRRFLEPIFLFFGSGFPRLVRDLRFHVLVTVVVFLGGLTAGARLVHHDPDRFYNLVGSDIAQGRGPHSDPDELRDIIEKRTTEADALSVFASFLVSNNAQVGLMSFGLGFLGGIPALVLVLLNALMLGAMAALYELSGMSLEFWAWVLPHGITEIFAICLCGAAGLRVGQSFLFPGNHRRWEVLARDGRRAATVVVGSIALFAFAALIEGFFRQLVTSVPIRLTVAGVTAVLLTLYLTRAGRGDPASHEAPGLAGRLRRDER